MLARVRDFMAFYIKTFFLMNFVVGSAIYIFAPDRMSPVPGPLTMFLIAIALAIFAFLEVFRKR
jgi:hypothetical protein